MAEEKCENMNSAQTDITEKRGKTGCLSKKMIAMIAVVALVLAIGGGIFLSSRSRNPLVDGCFEALLALNSADYLDLLPDDAETYRMEVNKWDRAKLEQSVKESLKMNLDWLRDSYGLGQQIEYDYRILETRTMKGGALKQEKTLCEGLGVQITAAKTLWVEYTLSGKNEGYNTVEFNLVKVDGEWFLSPSNLLSSPIW